MRPLSGVPPWPANVTESWVPCFHLGGLLQVLGGGGGAAPPHRPNLIFWGTNPLNEISAVEYSFLFVYFVEYFLRLKICVLANAVLTRQLALPCLGPWAHQRLSVQHLGTPCFKGADQNKNKPVRPPLIPPRKKTLPHLNQYTPKNAPWACLQQD